MKKTIIGLLATLIMLASCGSNNPSNTIHTSDRSQRNFLELCEEFGLEIFESTGEEKTEVEKIGELGGADLCSDGDVTAEQVRQRRQFEESRNVGLPKGVRKEVDFSMDGCQIITYTNISTPSGMACATELDVINYFQYFNQTGAFKYN